MSIHIQRRSDGNIYYVIGSNSTSDSATNKALAERLTEDEKYLAKLLQLAANLSTLPEVPNLSSPWTERELFNAINDCIDRCNKITTIAKEAIRA